MEFQKKKVLQKISGSFLIRFENSEWKNKFKKIFIEEIYHHVKEGGSAEYSWEMKKIRSILEKKT